MMSSFGNTHWCYQCSQGIRPVNYGVMSCPHCNGGFVQELQELGHRPNPPDLSQPPDPVSGIMVAFETLLSGNDMNQRFGAMEALESFISQRSRSHNRSLHNSSRFDAFFNGAGSRESFAEPGLEELIEQLSVNDRQGPPPAPRSAIDAMPTVKITRAHLRTDSSCSVCMDEFVLGTEVKRMPCNHIYHSDCIVPWLAQHNTCPVCRHELPTVGSTSRSTSGGDGLRNSFSFLGTNRPSNSANTRTTNGGNRALRYNRWPFDY